MAGPSTLRHSEARVLGGRYELRMPIGSGGMASVWLADDRRLGRRVAVKLLSEGLAADPTFAARFHREAHVAASLTHPNLVRIFDFDANAERPYLVMEYVPGPNLAQRLERGDEVPVERLAGDLLGALDAIHRAGVIHRDVKPQNVLLAADGRALLTDFGIARSRDATSITQTGHVPGTARYMAPELLRGEESSPASDLYACGVVLLECIPAGSGTRVATLAKRLAAARPGDRPASAAAALDELWGPRSEGDLAAVSAGVSRPGPEPVGRTIHLDRSRLAAVGALLAALALVGALVASSGDDALDERANRLRAASAGESQAATRDGAGQPSGERAAPKPDRGDASPAPPDPAGGAALNDEGYSLLQAGNASEAVPVLERAVRSFPAGTDDIDYAYALFNLGKALREAGRPEDAIPILRKRLEIPNQTEVVRAELEAALAEADAD